MRMARRPSSATSPRPGRSRKCSETTRASLRSARPSRCMGTCSVLPAPSRPPPASSRSSVACCPRRSTSTTPTPNAILTTFPTRHARRTSRWRFPTHSVSADTTRASSSRPRRSRRDMASQLDFKELQELAAEILGIEPGDVQLDKSFQRDLAADSLDLVELIAAIEDKYDVELSEEELERMKVIGDLWKFLEQKTAERLEA